MSSSEKSFQEEIPQIEGFKWIEAKGQIAGLDHGMQVQLDHDFYMGVHEVTCGEFKEYLASEKNDSLMLDNCNKDSLPVTNVTYFDAVLLANYLSEKEGHDRVYRFTNAIYDAVGHCVNLEGLTLDFDADGFRLPTEAEWVLAAQKGWNPLESWNNENSSFEAHPVCTRALPESGLCDMAGNVMEWVNDWKGSLTDTLINDFVGFLDGGSIGERVVKGGSYKNAPSSMTLTNQSDVYTVSSSDYSDYLGFRLAKGRIPQARWMNGQHQVLSTNIYVRLETASLSSWIGVSKAKLAFRNDKTGNLVMVDYTDWHPQVVEIEDTMEVYHPEISPDGNWVAFSTLFEGIAGKSSIYVRKYDVHGSNLIKLDVESAAVPRWKVLDNGDTVIVYVTDGENNKEEAIFKSKATWQVSFANGKFGKPEKILDGAYNGGAYQDLAVSGARLLRARSGSTEEIWYEGEQACNASLSQDGSKQTLFLDFASPKGQEFVGQSYGVHQRILVADSAGKLIKSIAAPKGFAFDHTEWTVGNGTSHDIAVATLTDKDGNHGNVVLVNMQDSNTTVLVSGDEIWHPCFWIRSRSHYVERGLSPDSAGMYHDLSEMMVENSMKVKMRLFWDYKDSLEMIAVGSSRTERGFDPLQITRQFALNAGGCGAEMQTGIYFLRHYALNHAKSLKTMVVELSPDVFRWPVSALYSLLYYQAPGYVYDRNHDFWKTGVTEDFLNLVDENMVYSHEDSVKYVETWGLYKRDAAGWGDLATVDHDSVFSKTELKNAQSVMDSLEALLAETADRNIRVIGVVYPQSPRYAQTGSFGRHGAPRTYASELLVALDSLTLKFPHFILMDENKMGQHDYTDDMAEDSDHLSALGAVQFTRRLDSLVNRLE